MKCILCTSVIFYSTANMGNEKHSLYICNILQHYQHEKPVENKGQLVPVRICDSSGKIQLMSPPEYIKTVLQLEKGLLSMHFCRTDAKGKELTRIIVYRKEDIVMDPMNSRDVLPKNVPGVG